MTTLLLLFVAAVQMPVVECFDIAMEGGILIFTIIVDSFFLIDIFLNFNTAVEIDKRLVVDRRRIAVERGPARTSGAAARRRRRRGDAGRRGRGRQARLQPDVVALRRREELPPGPRLPQPRHRLRPVAPQGLAAH